MTHFSDAVAWTLIHFCWQAAAAGALYRIMAWLLARRTADARYISALGCMLLMLGLAAGTLAWELRSDPSPVLLSSPAAGLAEALAGNGPHAALPGASTSTAAPHTISLANLLPWIDGLWFAGVLVLSIRGLGGWWYLRRLRLSAITSAPAAVLASFDRIASALRISRAVTLKLSGAIDGPMTMGALRALVLLPLSALTSLGPEELEVVLAHELAHVKRADFFWNILQTVAETLFFFHPAVWWLSARIRHERELCCDDLALKICPNPVTYASALYRLEEHRSRHLRLAMALDGHQSRQKLLMRIARILGEPMTRIPSHRVRPISLAAACVGLFVVLLPVPQLMASFAPPQAVIKPVATEPAVPLVSPGVSASQGRHDGARASRNPDSRASLAAGEAPAFEAAAPQSEPAAKPHGDYIEQMKAAGYDVDLDKLISMKIQGVTPEYARGMAGAGFGKLSADELVACKIQGVTPEYVAQLRQEKFEINSIQDVISFRIFGLTPEFVAGMKAAGFDGLSSKQLLSMRVQGVTPEYARELKQKFPQVTADDLIKARIFRIDDEFIAQAQRHGFTNLPFDKLVKLRISGILDDESVKP